MATLEYTRTKDGRTFTITADRHGSYWVSLDGKVVAHHAHPQDYYGRPRFGSKKLEAEAIEEAKAAIDAMDEG